MAIDTSKPKEKRGGPWVIAQVAILVLYFLAPRMGYWGLLNSLSGGLGILFMGWGAMLLFVTARTIGPKNISPFPRPPKNAALVTNGPFRFIRHPMYLSVMLLVIGWSLFTTHVTRFILGLGISMFLVLKAQVEERYLLKKYPDYSDYSARTKAFFPGLY